MSGAIERVARAIWIIQRLDLDKCDMELEDVGNRYETYDMAIEAIKAMRDPTKVMVDAVRNIGGAQAGAYALAAWPTMIDAALQEPSQ